MWEYRSVGVEERLTTKSRRARRQVGSVGVWEWKRMTDGGGQMTEDGKWKKCRSRRSVGVKEVSVCRGREPLLEE